MTPAKGRPHGEASTDNVAGGTSTTPREHYKRPFDLALLVVIVSALAPLWLLLWIVIPVAIRLEDGGRVLHVQQRLGRDGRPFDIIKFRTMVEDAERLTRPVLAERSDPRSTRVGRVLRRLHVDELPQLVNVAKGDMSFVGSRPERPELTAKIKSEVPRFTERLRVRPGIAGLAQLRGAHHTSPRSKLRYDRLYIARMGPLLDVKLLGLCLWKAMAGDR